MIREFFLLEKFSLDTPTKTKLRYCEINTFFAICHHLSSCSGKLLSIFSDIVIAYYYLCPRVMMAITAELWQRRRDRRLHDVVIIYYGTVIGGRQWRFVARHVIYYY